MSRCLYLIIFLMSTVYYSYAADYTLMALLNMAVHCQFKMIQVDLFRRKSQQTTEVCGYKEWHRMFHFIIYSVSVLQPL